MTIVSETASKKETVDSPSSTKLPRKHRYSNSTGRSSEWDDIIRGETSQSSPRLPSSPRDKAESGPSKSAKVGSMIPSSSAHGIAPSSAQSKESSPSSGRYGMLKRTAMVADLSTPAFGARQKSEFVKHNALDEDAYDSDASDSSIVIHAEEQILSDDEVQAPKSGISAHSVRLDLSQVPRGPQLSEASSAPAEPKLRAHATKQRVPVMHGPKIRAWRKAVGPNWTTPMLGDNTRAFVIATIEAMYYSGHTLVSQRLMGRYRGMPPPAPILKPHSNPLKSSLPDDFDPADLDDELEEDEPEPADAISRVQPFSSPTLNSPRVKILTSASSQVLPANSSGSPRGTPEQVAPSSSPRSASKPIPWASQKNNSLAVSSSAPSENDSEPKMSPSLKTPTEVSKRQPATPGLLSSLLGRIRRQTPNSSPTSPAEAHGSSQLATSSDSPSAALSTLTSPVPGLDSVLMQLKRKFRPWDRLRRLRTSDPSIPPPSAAGKSSSALGQSQGMVSSTGGLSEAEEGSMRGSLKLPVTGVLRSSDGSNPASGSLFNREYIHGRQRLATTVESEVIRGPYFQRLQSHSKQMSRVADNIQYLHETAQNDLSGVNEKLGRLTTGYEGLEFRVRKLNRQMEDVKNRAQSANSLLLDNISKTRNAIQHIKFKQKTKPPMRLLMAVLGWLVLIVGTLIWLFTATFRAVVRTGRYLKAKATGVPFDTLSPRSGVSPGSSCAPNQVQSGERRPSHPTRRGGSTATDPNRFIPITSKSYGQLLQSVGGAHGVGIPELERDFFASTADISNFGQFTQNGSNVGQNGSNVNQSELNGSVHIISQHSSSSNLSSLKSSLHGSYDSSSSSATSVIAHNDQEVDNRSPDTVASARGTLEDQNGLMSSRSPLTPSDTQVQLEPRQLQTLEDMSRSIKALRMQDKAAKKKAALERVRGSPH